MNKKIITILLISIILALILSGCPANEVEPFISDIPTADITSVAKQTRKSATFTLTSAHPVNSVWRAYEAETGGDALVDVDVSHLPTSKALILTYRHNDLPAQLYWISVKEPNKDESLRLGLTVTEP